MLSKQISELYIERGKTEKVLSTTEPKLSFVDFLDRAFLRRYGLKRIADQQLHIFIASIHKYKEANAKVNTFGRFCGLYNVLSNETLHVYLRFLLSVQVGLRSAPFAHQAPRTRPPHSFYARTHARTRACTRTYRQIGRAHV